MRTTGLMIALFMVLTVALVGCKKGGGATPEDAVKGMMEAAKAKNWEKVVSYMDIAGMVEATKKQFDKMTKGMPAEQVAEMKKGMADMMDVGKAKAKMIEEMKKDDKAPTSFKILEVKNKTENSAIVVVETTQGKETKKDEIPVKKIGNVWMLSFPGDTGETPTPEIEEPVTEPPVIEEEPVKEIPDVEAPKEEPVEEPKEK